MITNMKGLDKFISEINTSLNRVDNPSEEEARKDVLSINNFKRALARRYVNIVKELIKKQIGAKNGSWALPKYKKIVNQNVVWKHMGTILRNIKVFQIGGKVFGGINPDVKDTFIEANGKSSSLKVGRLREKNVSLVARSLEYGWSMTGKDGKTIKIAPRPLFRVAYKILQMEMPSFIAKYMRKYKDTGNIRGIFKEFLKGLEGDINV